MPADSPVRSWREAFLVYRHPRVLGMVFLGFSAGLPFLLIFSTLSTWLREAEISLTVIGFFSWVGITFSVKVLWAPIVDRTPLPLLTRLLGRRRGWMLLAQVCIALALLGIATTDPAQQLAQVAVFAVLVAFSSATQDIAIDAYRIEAVAKDLQGAMAATYQLGYRLGLLVAGAGALYIAEYSWPLAYMTMAGLMVIGMATTLIIREPELTRDTATARREERVLRFVEARAHLPSRQRKFTAWFFGAVVSPFVDFFSRYGRLALVILAFVGLYRLSDITMGIMANPFYIDLGFTKTEIANVSKVFGFFMSMFGAFTGGLLVARYGIMRPLLLGAVLVATTNLAFAILAARGHDVTLLAVTISADNVSGGIAVSAFIAYLSSLTNRAYTATQYALFSSFMTLPGKLLGGFSGVIVDATSYFHFFIYASVMGIPAILLVIYLMLRNRAQPLGEAAAEG